MNTQSTISRRTLLRSGGAAMLATAAGSTFPPPANAFIQGLIARALMALVGGTVGRVGAVRAGSAAVSALTRRRAVHAVNALAKRNSIVRKPDTLFGNFSQGLAYGTGSEVGRFATNKFLDSLTDGYGVVPGRGRPLPSYPEDDVTYGGFPNHGSRSDLIILGCPDLLLLEALFRVMKHKFSAHFGYGYLPMNLALGFYPIDMDQAPDYDDVFVSRKPTVFVTGGCVITIRSFRAHNGRYSSCRIRDRYNGRYLYEHDGIPLHPQFN